MKTMDKSITYIHYGKGVYLCFHFKKIQFSFEGRDDLFSDALIWQNKPKQIKTMN